MKKFGKWVAGVIGLYVLQTSILPLLAFHGISPNLMLLFSVSFAFLRGPYYGVLMGFCVGLMQDLATGTFFGIDVFSYMLISFICGKFSNQVFKDQLFLPVLASVAAAFIHYCILAEFMFLLGYHFNLVMHAQNTLLPMMCYQFVMAYPVHKLVCWMDKYIRDGK